ncbi:Uncharacterized protein HZ326_17148 [Fusarium oxysporum f. sp. albedinis]|nr:Uncharacterized protein HZ326_17148 [Fusarium oxysporum f. sp. albedinis]
MREVKLTVRPGKTTTGSCEEEALRKYERELDGDDIEDGGRRSEYQTRQTTIICRNGEEDEEATKMTPTRW